MFCKDTDTEELRVKITQLIPLAFEAVLSMGTTNNGNARVVDELSLSQLIDEASKLGSEHKIFALIADMILGAATQNNRSASSPRLPISKAASLLGRLVSAIRHLPGYDTPKAARWIRCIVQLVLDARPSTSNTTARNPFTSIRNLDLVKTIIEQALALARSSGARINDADGDVDMDGTPSAYPPDELEWLAATLFNLGIDCYVAEDEAQARFWAGKAVEIADVVAESDKGMLARMLRGKCGELSWDV